MATLPQWTWPGTTPADVQQPARLVGILNNSMRGLQQVVALIAAAAATGGGAVSSVFTRTGAVTAQSGDYSVAQVTGAAPLASPTLTGTPTAPTASAGTNSTQLATTAYTDLQPQNVATLTGTTTTLTAAQCLRTVHLLTCTTATIVKLAAHLQGQSLYIKARAAGTANITLQDNGGTQLIVLAPGMAVYLNDDGSVWEIG